MFVPTPLVQWTWQYANPLFSPGQCGPPPPYYPGCPPQSYVYNMFGIPYASPKMRACPPIYFYHRGNPFYGFTNFSEHEVWYDGKRYPTSEHLYQSFKFIGYHPRLAEAIRKASSASAAMKLAKQHDAEKRPDWFNINIPVMEAVLECKFTQHKSLQRELLSTGDAELIEDSDKDSFWGIGAKRNGRNELGNALMRLRDRMRRNSRHYSGW